MLLAIEIVGYLDIYKSPMICNKYHMIYNIYQLIFNKHQLIFIYISADIY